MELYQLRHFLAVAETGSYTRGAQRAAVTQPAISTSLAKLESELGTRLFDRAGRETRLTAAGLRFRDVAAGILSACAGVKAELRAVRTGAAIRFGVLNTLPIDRVGSLCRHFRMAHPEAVIELMDGPAETLDSRLAEGRLDVALTRLDGKADRSAKLRSRVLATEPYVLVAPVGHRLAAAGKVGIADLNGEAFITRTSCETFRKTTEYFVSRGIRPNVVYRTDQDERAIAMVKAGLGVALMPASFQDPEVVQVPVHDFPSSRRIGLRWRSEPSDALLERFVAFAAMHLWAGPRRDPGKRPAQPRRHSST
ncbi:MAG: LysR family transcriptional regulator [Burkholderiales bacterium]